MMQSNDKSEAKINPVSNGALAQPTSIENQGTSESGLSSIPTDHTSMLELVTPKVSELKANLLGADSAFMKQNDSNITEMVKSTQEISIQGGNSYSTEESVSSGNMSSLVRAIARRVDDVCEMVLPVVALSLTTFGAVNLGLSALCLAASQTLIAFGAESPYLLQSLVTECANYGFPAILLGMGIGLGISDNGTGDRSGRSD